MTRIAGHGLHREGAAYDDNGNVVTSMFQVVWGGPGRAKCECGVLSEVLPSGAARRRWHREIHKLEVSGR